MVRHLFWGDWTEEDIVAGERTGWQVVWRADNTPRSIDRVRRGKRHGKSWTWDDEGRPDRVAEFCDGHPCGGERLEEDWKPDWWCEELLPPGSEPRCACPEGTRLEGARGELQRCVGPQDVTARSIQWDANGRLLAQTRQDPGSREGVGFVLYRDGELRERYTIRDGNPKGPYARYAGGGARLVEGSYCAYPYSCGLQRRWDSYGHLAMEGHYTELGKKHGYWRIWDPNGGCTLVCYQLDEEVWRKEHVGWDPPKRPCPDPEARGAP